MKILYPNHISQDMMHKVNVTSSLQVKIAHCVDRENRRFFTKILSRMT